MMAGSSRRVLSKLPRRMAGLMIDQMQLKHGVTPGQRLEKGDELAVAMVTVAPHDGASPACLGRYCNL